MKSCRLLFFLLPFSLLQAQSVNKTVLYSLTEKDGLTDNTVNCFYQDSRGVMWMGTGFGLNSFDGSLIRNYHASGQAGSLPDEAVNAIKEDDKKNLWIATGNGLCSFSLLSKSFTSYFFPGEDKTYNRFYSLDVLGDQVYLATENGLVIFNITSHQFTFIRNSHESAAANRIQKVFIDRKKNIWLCTYYGVWLFHEQNKTFESYDNASNDKLFDDQLVNDIYEDKKGQLWFGTWSRGLKRLDAASKTVETFQDFPGSNTNVVTITELKNQAGGFDLVIGSELLRADLEKKKFTPLIRSERPGPFYVNRIYTDRDNLLWMSTSEGVKIYNPAKQFFRTISLSASVPVTSQGVALFPLGEKFLMGGEGGTSLQLFSDSLILLKNLSGQLQLSAAVMNIQQDRQKKFWLCTSNGLVVLDEQLKPFKTFLHDEKDPGSLPKNFLNNLLLKRDGEIWIMPWRKGIWKMNDAGKFQYVITKNGDSLFNGGNISKAIEDSNGNIWATDYTGGLYKYIASAGVSERIIKDTRLTNEYLSGNQLWTVSSNAVYRVDVNTNRVETFPMPPGKNKYQYDFVPDDDSNLWIATKTGLLSFSNKDHIFQQYTTSDGLFTDVLDVSMTKLSNGNILLAGGTFATIFNPGMAKEKTREFPLLFTGSSFDGNEKEVNSNSISFAWNEKNIRLSWALLNYSNPLDNVYYYKLDGVNNEWQTAGNRGEINFNSLAPGRYVFHYKAATSHGEMSAEKTIMLVIHPPFWKTWWFVAVIIAVLSFLFYRIVRYVSQRNLKEKLLQLEKEQAIEKERNRISRDMHDELGSGLTKIAILTDVIKAQQHGNEQVEKISTTARNLVDSLDEMVWVLNPQNDSLDKLAGYIAEYAHQYLEGSNIECRVELPQEIEERYISEEKRRNIFMVVKEFLNNTVKHSGAKTVLVRLLQTSNGFALLLKDDGKGFAESDISQTGNGIKNMKQRVKDAGGSAAISSGPGGTTLTLTFNH